MNNSTARRGLAMSGVAALIALSFSISGRAGAGEKNYPHDALLKFDGVAPESYPTINNFDRYVDFFGHFDTARTEARRTIENAQDAIKYVENFFIYDNAELHKQLDWKFANCQIYKNELDAATGDLVLEIKDLNTEKTFPADRVTIRVPKRSLVGYWVRQKEKEVRFRQAGANTSAPGAQQSFAIDIVRGKLSLISATVATENGANVVQDITCN